MLIVLIPVWIVSSLIPVDSFNPRVDTSFNPRVGIVLIPVLIVLIPVWIVLIPVGIVLIPVLIVLIHVWIEFNPRVDSFRLS